jgi:23S rRNA (pseudouridine1915-N3)-methyltransferase
VRISLFFIGKPRDEHANGMAEEFIRRTQRYARCEMREIKPGRADFWPRLPAAFKVLLDPTGKTLDSRQFTALVEKLEREGRDLAFVIGGADGLPDGWRSRADLLLSLSSLTFPHELARVVLAEQIYRAITSLRGHPYPR